MNLLDFFWAMILIWFWFIVIWMFIRIFADIFRRTDISAVMKVVWIIALFILPFVGALIYLITRKPTAQEMEDMQMQQQMQTRAAASSTADEIAKLQQLKDSGALTQQEFDTAKAKALA